MNQRGFMSLSSLIFLSIVLVLVFVVGMRMVPAYIEFFSIKKIINEIADDPEVSGGTPQDIRNSFMKRASINNIKVITASDIEISREGGELVLAASYPVKIEMVGNVSVCIDFSATTAKGGS